MTKKLLVSLLATPILAFAAGTTATVTWVLPTSYNDGTALPPGDIANVTLTWTPLTAGGPKAGSVVLAGTATSSVIPVPCGGITLIATVTTTATALYPNATSASSGPVSYASGVACQPNPPGNLTAK